MKEINNKKQRISSNTILLLIINTIRKIIDIFLGPFLLKLQLII